LTTQVGDATRATAEVAYAPIAPTMAVSTILTSVMSRFSMITGKAILLAVLICWFVVVAVVMPIGFYRKNHPCDGSDMGDGIGICT
jgi:hypothetical protein